MAEKYEFSTGGKLFTIERPLIRGGIAWHATQDGGDTTIATGRSAEEVLAKLIEGGTAGRERLPRVLYMWNEVRR